MNSSVLSNVTSTPGPANTAGYIEALQICAAILTMFLAGFFWKLVKTTGPTKALLHAFNSFMFNIGIPCLAFKGLAIQKFSLLPWSFIAVFFCLRAAMFVIVFGFEFLIRRQTIGAATMVYCNSTWFNSIIFGLPIIVALYGPQYAVFPVFASISSFFFQLPLQLILFEVDKKIHPPIPSVEMDKPVETWWSGTEVHTGDLRLTGVWIPRVLLSIVLNPIILAIVGGVLFSLTGWPLPSYLNSFCTYTGDAVTPMAAFAIGVFACRKPSTDVRLWISVVIQVIVIKFFVMPLLAMPFMLAFNIVGIPRKIGVLMSALPVALSCYVLSVRYDVQVQHSVNLIIFSTVLMLPTQLMWIGILESMGW